MKICQSCKVPKYNHEFHKRSKAKDGLQGRCKECNKEQRKAYYKTAHGRKRNLTSGKRLHAQNAMRLIKYLKDHPCVDCGEKDIVVLQFDHKDTAEKSFSISKAIKGGYSWEKKIEPELKKCDVRCANCHTRRTAKQFNWLKLKIKDT